MNDNWILLGLPVLLALLIGIGLGLLVVKFSGRKDPRVKELEEKAAQSKKELEEYRAQVNEHFLKTSQLIEQMNKSYCAIFQHMATSSQALCSAEFDAARLKPVEDAPSAAGQTQSDAATQGDPFDKKPAETTTPAMAGIAEKSKEHAPEDGGYNKEADR